MDPSQPEPYIRRAAAGGIVEGNDDLLMAILIELSPKSIFRLRCVSKRWNYNIIGGSCFLQSYRRRKKEEQRHYYYNKYRRRRLVAFIQSTPYRGARYYDPPQKTIIPVASATTDELSTMMKEVPSSFGEMINVDSNSGLILFDNLLQMSATSTKNINNNLYILNPLTGISVVLPPPPSLDDDEYTLGLVCEENTNELKPSYIVVAVAAATNINPNTSNPRCYSSTPTLHNTLAIQTYSSKTHNWGEKTTLICTGKFKLFYKAPPVISNGVFHWIATTRSGYVIALYDSKIIDNNHVQLIELPDDPHVEGHLYGRSSTHDVLWVFVGFPQISIDLLMLPKTDDCNYRRSTTIPKDEWILMHRISTDSLRIDITNKMLLVEAENDYKRILNEILESFGWIELADFIPKEYPFLAVLKVGEDKLCLYDVVTKSFELVSCCGPSVDDSCWVPYLEPLCLSSYALSPTTAATGQ